MATAVGTPPAIASDTPAGASQAVRFDFDSRTNLVQVVIEGDSGRCGFTGSEGGALSDSNSFPLADGEPLTIRIAAQSQARRSGSFLLVETNTGANQITVLAMR